MLDAGKPALLAPLSPEEQALSAPLFLLTDKPTIFACNVKESDLATAETNPYVVAVRDYVKTHLACEAVVISAQIESDLVDLAPDEAQAFLLELGVPESGLGALIRATYHLLGLQTYFTAGEKEVRAWTIHVGDTAPKAAGVIHSDFERGFIKAETVAYDDLDPVRLGRRRARTGRCTGWKARNTSWRTGTCCCSSSMCRGVLEVLGFWGSEVLRFDGALRVHRSLRGRDALYGLRTRPVRS